MTLNYTPCAQRTQLPAGLSLSPTVQTGPREDGGGGGPSRGSHASRALTTVESGCACARTRAQQGRPGPGRRKLFGKVPDESVGSYVDAPGPSPLRVSDVKGRSGGGLPLVKNPPLVSRRPVATVEESTGLRDGRFSRDTTDRSSRHTRPLASRLPGHRRALPGSQGGHPRASPAPPPLLPSELLFRQHVPPAPGPTGNIPCCF